MTAVIWVRLTLHCAVHQVNHTRSQLHTRTTEANWLRANVMCWIDEHALHLNAKVTDFTACDQKPLPFASWTPFQTSQIAVWRVCTYAAVNGSVLNRTSFVVFPIFVFTATGRCRTHRSVILLDGRQRASYLCDMCVRAAPIPLNWMQS